jgi:hypothetical protein
MRQEAGENCAEHPQIKISLGINMDILINVNEKQVFDLIILTGVIRNTIIV